MLQCPSTKASVSLFFGTARSGTDDSAADPRLEGHPYQGVVVSYHSVPLVTAAGELWGTLSHFDMASLPLSDDEFELLQSAARLLPSFLVEG
ncbi:GAF domain-containing protein [Variovorax sp. LjRoot290]|uniref:GAF domain-containing protein n=1 Tax=unclassified Variovorax TaxID=663243 RepID=UPI003ED10E6F